jgi:preprotein translocase subunit SecF
MTRTDEAREPAAADSMTRSPNFTILLTGLAVLVLGVLLVLDAGGVVDLRFAYMAPVLVGALGAILLASGLAGRGRGRG